MIDLPRHARDKQRENSKQGTCFSQGNPPKCGTLCTTDTGDCKQSPSYRCPNSGRLFGAIFSFKTTMTVICPDRRGTKCTYT